MTRFALLLLVIVPVLVGCQTVPAIGPVVVAGESISNAEPVAIDISNRVGSVTVLTDATLGRPVITATCIGSDGRVQPAPWAAAELVRGDPFPVLRVLVANDGAAKATDVTVHVPAIAGLRVRNAGGNVRIEGAAGAIDVQNGSGVVHGGDVSIRFGSPLDAPFMARTSTGSLTVTIPPGSKGSVHATAGGSVVSVRAQGEAISDASGVSSDWKGVLNGGAHDVRLIAERGPVMLRVRR